MNQPAFDSLLENRIALIKSVLASKKTEYASDTDRLSNFKRAAAILNVSPEKALMGMAVKHLVSILDIVDKKVPADIKAIDEKIGDMICYMVLLEAILKEHN